MAHRNGLTEAVMGALSELEWRSAATVIARIPEKYRWGVAPVLSQKANAGKLERRGKRPNVEYRIAAVPAAAGPETESDAPSWPAGGNGDPLSASLGTRCEMPKNASQGRIEDAIAAVLGRRKSHELADVLAGLPAGWSRSAAVSAIADGVIAGWVGSYSDNGTTYYQLRGAPPQAAPDPLVDRYKSVRMRDQLKDLDEAASAAIVDAREFAVHPDVISALSDARSCLRRAARRLP